MQLENVSAVVTGGAAGLGLASARRLVAAGARVVLLDLPSAPGEQAAAEFGDAAVFVPADVTDEAQVQAAVERATELGPLSVVVNCAGIVVGKRVIGKDGTPFPLDAFVKTIQVNLVGTFNVIRLASAAMVATPVEGEERGVIVNTASVAGIEGQIGQAAYSASKGGVIGMTLPVARDLAQHRIRVATIAPGLFRTAMFESLPEEAITSLEAQTPHPARLGEPSEFAQLVLAIIENPMINGEVIRLDAAIRLGPR